MGSESTLDQLSPWSPTPYQIQNRNYSGVDKESGVPLGRATSYLADSSGVKSQVHAFRQQTVDQFAHLRAYLVTACLYPKRGGGQEV